MKNDSYRSMHRDLSTKSLSRTKVSLEPKPLMTTKVIHPPLPKKE